MNKILLLPLTLLLINCGGSSSEKQSVEKPTVAVPQTPQIDRILAIGDSLTAQYIVNGELQNVSGKEVINLAVGGQGSKQIASRLGQRASTIELTEDVSTIGNYYVESIDINPIQYSDLTATCSDLETIDCQLFYENDILMLSINRFDSDTPINSITTRFQTPEISNNDIAIVWIGRNNYAEVDDVIADTNNITDWLTENNVKYIVLSLINGATDWERKGNQGYKWIIEINDALESTFDDKYLNVRQALIDNYNANSEQDTQDFNDDTVPASLRTDDIHLNDAGVSMVSHAIYDFLYSKSLI